jgi:Helix-turn-helix domain
MEHVSSMDFASTVERIVDALTEAGLMLFARIDHAAGARDAGMEMPPATVLILSVMPKGAPPSCWLPRKQRLICRFACWCGSEPILTPHQRREAAARLERGETQCSVARSYNVSQATISRITTV